MDVNTLPQASLLFLTFLRQSPSQNQEFEQELQQLSRDVSLGADLSFYTDDHRVADPDIECDGELECDGYSPTRSVNVLQDIFPLVHFPGDADIIRNIAGELVIIADDLNRSIMSQTAESLAKQLTRTYSLQRWQELVDQSVAHLLARMPEAQSEQVVIAITFSLVKAVCEQVPPLLQGLYSLLMSCFSQARPR